ncbi:band 7 protein [Gloeothece citriformis PCC 7424]|uniref:Band 7 protein n=1 Tax=Gloeothece citriformis (strain PCC 7424) TaxID=65393 RepID=B7KL42_GLOC7|nr:SPFH domain-containing protein [Gloeothece citriformis]ACK72414.1 band 7 protein [Gloeothece citriformis PCC 7424]
MKFWLFFIQSLPTIPFSELDNQEVEINPRNSINSQDNQVNQMIQEIPTHPQMSQVNIGEMSGLIGISLIAGTILLLFIIAVWLYTRFYVITPNNEAFVRTGGVFQKSKSVILNGGCIVLPGFHEITRVPLREISIDVVRSGNLAVRTQDYLRANMRVTFYVCIEAIKEDVISAASRLSKQGKVSESDIKEALEKRADDAIRAAAKRKTIAEIDSDKTGFAQEVFDLIQRDLKKVGLTLNNIAISEIEESDTYDENNFFDAQGVKLRTETIQRAIKQKLDVELKTHQEKKELELNTKVALEQKELTAEKLSLEITREKEDARLTQEKQVELLKLNQQKEIELLKAQRQREIQETQAQEIAKIERTKILQERAVEEERIQKQLAVQQSQIEADITLEERNKQLKVAKTLQLQESEVAEITRQKTIESSRLQAQAEIALAEQDSKIAQQEAGIAIASKEKERFGAEAEKAQAEASVITATEVEKAEREKRLSTISAEQEAEKRRIADNNVVEIEVFRRRRQAEIARQAADLEAESIRTLADAHRYQALAEAEAKQALIEAQNALSDANRAADLIKAIWPDLAPQLPEIVKALTPQPGILGDARIYAFPGLNGHNGNGNSSTGDLNKLLLSTSGLSLINTLLDEGKLGALIAQIKQLLSSDGNTPPQTPPDTFSEAVNPVSTDISTLSFFPDGDSHE